MALGTFVFNELSPAGGSTAASSVQVAGAANYLPAGVAGPLDDYSGILIAADLVGPTGGTLDVSVQSSPDQGASWYEIVRFPQLAAGAPAVSFLAPISEHATVTAPIVTGKGTTQALAQNTIVPGVFTDRVRLLMKAGAGAAAGSPVKVTVMGQGRFQVR